VYPAFLDYLPTAQLLLSAHESSVVSVPLFPACDARRPPEDTARPERHADCPHADTFLPAH